MPRRRRAHGLAIAAGPAIRAKGTSIPFCHDMGCCWRYGWATKHHYGLRSARNRSGVRAPVIQFSRTERFLRQQRFGGQAGIVIALMILFMGWGVWLVFGTISIYAVSQSARLEVAELPVQVQTPVSGQVTIARVELGRAVRRGALIVQLDTTRLRLRREELEVAVRTGAEASRALQAELAAEEGVQGAVERVARRSSQTAKARTALDQKALEFKQEESAIGERLHEASVISGIDALRSEAETETQRSKVFLSSAQAALDEATSAMNLRERETRLAAVRLNIVEAQAQVARWKAQIDTLDHEIEQHSIRAPVDGVIADIMTISVGMTLTSQQHIATLIPEGPVRVVSRFAPQQNGRLRAGQPATLRFDAFPWTQFGTVTAHTSAVGQEPRDGSLRVELVIVEANPSISLRHGMTGSCEIEVERTSPLRLLLRAIAQLAAPAVPPPEATSAGGPLSRVVPQLGAEGP